MHPLIPARAARWALAAFGLATALSTYAPAAVPAAAPSPAPSPYRLTDADGLADVSGPVVATPADLYGPLFRAVELGHVFPDSKSFADAVPRRDIGAILLDYRTSHPRGTDALRRFALANFAMPAMPATPVPAPRARRARRCSRISRRCGRC